MTDRPDTPFADPTTAPYWEAVARRELLIQRCDACDHWQFPPRPFCLACYADAIRWQRPSGLGTVYSATTVRLPVLPDLPPPYVVAVVELDEGPRLTAHLLAARTDASQSLIGRRARLAWWHRPEGPPLPAFRLDERSDEGPRPG